MYSRSPAFLPSPAAEASGFSRPDRRPTPGGAPFPGERCGRPVQRLFREDVCLVILVCSGPTPLAWHSGECWVPGCRSRSVTNPGGCRAEAVHLPGMGPLQSTERKLVGCRGRSDGRRCLLAPGCASPVCPGAFRGACPAVAEAAAEDHLPGSSSRSSGYRYLGAHAGADSFTPIR